MREGVRLVSFAGAPTKDAIGRLHDAGILVMPTVGARRHAEKMLDWGVDAVIAQGGEGGGHTGTVPTSLLLPQVVDAVGHAIPVLGAGGFHDGRGLVAALAWGADGVAMGTRFLLTAESRVPDEIKARYLAASVTDTVVTTALDGAPQRVIRTETVDRLERSSLVTRLPRALRSALEFRKVTGTPHRRPRARGAGHAQEPGPHLGPAGHGGQRPDADQGRAGRRATPRWACCRPARSRAWSTSCRRSPTCSTASPPRRRRCSTGWRPRPGEARQSARRDRGNRFGPRTHRLERGRQSLPRSGRRTGTR